MSNAIAHMYLKPAVAVLLGTTAKPVELGLRVLAGEAKDKT